MKPVIKLWLDDVRNPFASPYYLDEEWRWAKTVGEAMVLCMQNDVLEMSLDHDLGLDAGTGYTFVQWMVKTATWPQAKPAVHSANPQGKKAMEALIEFHWPLRAVKRHDVNHGGRNLLGTHEVCPDPFCCSCWCPGCVTDWRAIQTPGPAQCPTPKPEYQSDIH